MDPVVEKEVRTWLKQFPDDVRVADLGSFQINASVKEIFPSTIGFDLQEGRGVDVVLQDGIIPDEYKGKFDVVTAVQSYQFSPNPDLFKQEIIQLLKPGGRLLLTTCAEYCQLKHMTSSVTSKLPPRRSKGQAIIRELGPEIEVPTTKAVEWSGHITWIFFGKLA